MIDINIDIDKNNYDVDKKKIRYLIQSILSFFQLSRCELSLSLVDNQTIKRINNEYRNKNKVTDVLSFPQINWEEPLLIKKYDPNYTSFIHSECLLLGDIVVSLEQTKVNALHINQGIDREFCFLVVHSILHLLGHNHEIKTEEIVMVDQQKKIMTLLESDKQCLWKDCIKEK